MEDLDADARTTTAAAKESSHDDLDDVDPLAAARSALVGEDRAYWAAHPEIPALVSYFLANGE